MKLIPILMATFLLAGCGGTQLTSDMLDSVGIKENVAVVADNFTIRELGMYRTQQVRLEQYAKMHRESGVQVNFEVKEISGVVYILPQISYKERPELIPVSMQPSSHPIWGFATSLAKYGLIGYGIHEIAGTLQAGYDAAQGATYNGHNSGNYVGRDYASGGEYVQDSNSRTLLESQNSY